MKDLLTEITKLRSDVAEVRADVAAHRAETAAHRKETAKGFADLDAELEKHASRAHRDPDARIGRLEKRTAPKKVSARPLRRR